MDAKLRALCGLILVALSTASNAAPRQEEERVDPRAEFLADLTRRLRSHRFFSVLGIDRLPHVDGHGTARLYIQPHPGGNANHTKVVSKFYGPWMERLEANFVRDYVTPLGLEPNDAVPAFVCVVLSSRGSYEDYARAVQARDLNFSRAHYNPELRLAITYDDPFVQDHAESTEAKRQPALHEFVHALQHRYHLYDQGPPVVSWFNEGLADYLSFHLGHTPDALDRGLLDKRRMDSFRRVYRNPISRRVYVNALEDLLRIESYGAVVENAKKRAKKEATSSNGQAALGVFYDHAYLLMHFLHRFDGGRYRGRVVEFCGNVLLGTKGEKAFKDAFEGVDLAVLESEFSDFVASYGGEKPDASAGAPTAGAGLTEPLAAEAFEVASEPAPFDPTSLGLGDTDSEAWVGMALSRAMEGAVDEGVELLEARHERVAGAERERVDLELMRLRAWGKLRDTYLADLVASGGKLTIEWGGSRLIAPVVGVGEGRIELGENRREVESIPLSALAPPELALRLGSKLASFGPGWLRLYPYCVTGNEKWKKLMKRDKGAELDALRADAEAFYPQVMAVGGAAVELQALASLAEKPDEEAAAILDRLHRLGARKDSPLVAARRDSLVELGRRALTSAAEELSLSELAGMELRPNAKGAVKITEFDQGPGFERRDDYLESRRDEWGPLSELNGVNLFSRSANRFNGNGATSLHYRLPFEAPMTVRLKLRLELREDLPNDHFDFSLGICTDEYENYILCSSSGDLHVRNGNVADRAISVLSRQFFVGKPYTIELRHDGTTVRSSLNGKPSASMDAHGLKSGEFMLWVHSEVVLKVTHLEIEGVVGDAGLARLRQGWVDQRLAEFGFDG